MGLLDDAIREHLELKRRRGGNADEIERQEREALGAPRGGEFAKPDEEGAAQAEEAPQAAEEVPEEAPEPVEEAPEPIEEAPVAAEPPTPEPFDQEPADAPEAVEEEPELPSPGKEAGAPGYDEDPWLEEERDEVPRDEALEHAPDPEVVPADEPEPGEDVLEETPEFLQETPEHDRLWFEQKPPRDFDWDK
jgi:hypothetical protein